MVAYDYEAQRWVTGPDAAKLLQAQKAEDEELANNPAYLAFITKDEPEAHVHGCACDDCCDGWAQ